MVKIMIEKTKVIMFLTIFALLLCCISAASAMDVDVDVSDDDGDMDDVSNSDNVVERTNYQNPIDNLSVVYIYANVTDSNYESYFDASGYTNSTSNLNFVGNFTSKTFGNFKINKNVKLKATNANFNNIGFDIFANNVTLDGGNFVFNALSGANCYALNVENSSNVKITHTTVTYNCAYDNAANYNYVIKAINSKNLKIEWNSIVASLPLKTVNWNLQGISADYVAGAAIENCSNLSFRRNNLTITANRRVGDFPTLDAVMIVDCNNSYVGDNRISESDIITQDNQYSYIYGIDVYRCYNINIHNNTVNMNGNNSGGTYSGNGTGAAYCIQLTGSHTGVVISNNNLTTKNKGPNLGIYSQNYYGKTSLTIFGNKINVTGKAGSDPWSLVSGMELQDDYASVYGNNIHVKNTAGYSSSYHAYGISYSQYTAGNHRFEIMSNNVIVENGPYAVYIMNSNNSTITYNGLTATNRTGNDAVYITGNDNTVFGNYQAIGISKLISFDLPIMDYKIFKGRIFKSGSYIK